MIPGADRREQIARIGGFDESPAQHRNSCRKRQDDFSALSHEFLLKPETSGVNEILLRGERPHNAGNRFVRQTTVRCKHWLEALLATRIQTLLNFGTMGGIATTQPETAVLGLEPAIHDAQSLRNTVKIRALI